MLNAYLIAHEKQMFPILWDHLAELTTTSLGILSFDQTTNYSSSRMCRKLQPDFWTERWIAKPWERVILVRRVSDDISRQHIQRT